MESTSPKAAPSEAPARPKVVIVMPAYNAAKTLEDTFRRIPAGYYDEVVVVDDHSRDETTELAKRLSLKAIRHPHNVGYGGNQKTCYMEALRDGAGIVVMLHPDGQYDPAIIPEMIRPIQEGRADMVLGSRMMVPGGAARGGMPVWKRVANRFLTGLENLAMRRRFSECHTGYRAYSRRFLETVPFLRNSNGFVFDTEVIFQAVQFGLRVEEVPISTRYFADASSVGFKAGVVYGLGTLGTALRFVLHRTGLEGGPGASPTGPDRRARTRASGRLGGLAVEAQAKRRPTVRVAPRAEDQETAEPGAQDEADPDHDRGEGQRRDQHPHQIEDGPLHPNPGDHLTKRRAHRRPEPPGSTVEAWARAVNRRIWVGLSCSR
jgi:hypothetical protein